MRCGRARKMISQHLDGELGLAESKAFDTHIQGCPSCRQALEETRAFQQMFASAQRFPAPYGFATRVLANLEEKEGSRLRSLLSVRPFLLRAAQAAFAVVVMTLGIISGNLLLAERTVHIEPAAVQEVFSLDLFQAAPPDSVGGIYMRLAGVADEK